MYLKVASPSKANGILTIVIRCPHCGRTATLSHFPEIPDLHFVVESTGQVAGQRFCPNPECRGHIFFLAGGGRTISKIYPQERIDFEKENIPEKVLSVFEEAVACHAHGCYVASGMMVRRTLEEICQDRGATGKNLVDRIKQLRSKVILPNELLDALDELRLFGNDAAHIEAKDYENIGKEETEIAIELTKEILKSLYQLKDLLETMKKFRKVSTGSTPATP